MRNCGILEVHLINARGLKNDEILSGGITPYVLINYKNQQLKSKVALGQASKPVWDQKFSLRVEYPGGGENNKYKLILKVMDNDTFSPDDYLGESTIYLKDLLEQGVENGTATLKPQKYRVVDADGSYCGEILVALTFTCKNNVEEAIGEDFGGWKQSTYYY